MRSKFIPDPDDPVGDGVFNAPGDWVNPNVFTAASSHTGGSGAPSNNSPPLISPPQTPTLPDEAVEAQAAQNGPGGPGSVVAETAGSGITINLIFDAAAMAAPASFRAGIEQAASILSATITNKITVNLNIDYSGTGGGAAAGPDNGQFESYSTVRSDLINDAAPGDTTFNALPTGSTIQGQSQVAVWNAQLKLFGLLNPNDTTTDDGSATFATDIQPSLLVGVALHELTHALGRVPYGSQPDIFDFYRFTSVGTRLFTDNIPASAAYFSLNGGSTKLADFGVSSDPSDFLNPPGSSLTANDAFDEYYSGNTIQGLTAVDKEMLDALGFNTIINPTAIVVAATTSQAVQGGARVALLSAAPNITDPSSATLSSATIKIANAGGSANAGDQLFVNGVQNGSVGSGVTASWNASTDTLTLTGNATLAVYDTLLSEVSYQDTGADSSTGSHPSRTITWTANDGTTTFSTTSQITIERAPVAAVASVALSGDFKAVAASSLLTASDPDSDAIATYAFKDTSHGQFFLNGVAQANNQEIDVTAAQLSQLTYVSFGGTDSLQVRVSDGTLWSGWQTFTVTGPAATVIESYGVTSLVQVGSNYFMDPVAGGTGPELIFNGGPLTSGQVSSGYAIVGAEQTASGYEVAFKNASTNQFSIWNTDSSGKYLSYATYSGTSTALESLENSFHQDLNGDGVIGVPTLPPVSGTVIESYGVTSLVQVGSNYFMDPVAGGTGPELIFKGAPLTSGQVSSGYAIVGAEQTASGYEVAFKNGSTNQFSIWNTDNSGNYLSYAIYSGTSTALESLENSFHQDLNGDGVIGVPVATKPVAAPVSVTAVNNDTFVFQPGGGASDAENTASATTNHLDAFWSVSSNQLAALFHDAQVGQLQTISPSADVVHQTLDGHDHMTHDHMTIANLLPHTGFFMVH
jgi:serralysin